MLGGAATKIQAARGKLAKYVKARKQDLALVENCTAATAAVLRASRLSAGETIIHLSTAYGMVKNCIAYHAAAIGARVCELKVEFRGNGSSQVCRDCDSLEVLLSSLLDGILKDGSRVALVTLDYISSCPGVVLPVHALAHECKSRGIPVLLDGAHVLGQIHIDCEELEASGVTYFMADAHKWLFSPKGSAMLWVTQAAQNSCYPSVIGAVCSNSPTTSFNNEVLEGLSEFERRFQYTGTRDYTPLISIREALCYRQYLGESAILGYNHGMAIWAQEWLASLWNTETLLPSRCSAFMAHTRLPVSSATAAVLLSHILKEELAIYTLSFYLPARECMGELRPTIWLRPCMQLFVNRADVRALGAAVLEQASRVDATAKFGATWHECMAMRAKSKCKIRLDNASKYLHGPSAHKVTIGFSVPVADVICKPAETFDEKHGVVKRDHSALSRGGVASAVANSPAMSDSNYFDSCPLSLPALHEEGLESIVPDTVSTFKDCSSFALKNSSLARNGKFRIARSPDSVIDLGFSLPSSFGTCRVSAAFLHPDLLMG